MIAAPQALDSFRDELHLAIDEHPWLPIQLWVENLLLDFFPDPLKLAYIAHRIDVRMEMIHDAFTSTTDLIRFLNRQHFRNGVFYSLEEKRLHEKILSACS